MLAPIVLFVYNRPDHTQQTLDTLAKNDLAQDSVLYVFCDGAKPNSSQNQLEKIAETREIIKSEKQKIIEGKGNFKELIIKEQTQNIGLADSIVGGVSQVIEKYGKVIVLEDDIVTSKGFLKFMNESLDIYENEEKVTHISGYMYPINFESINSEEQTFFYPSTSCWGWATWQRAWKHFNPNTEELLNQLQEKKQLKKFNLDNTYRFSYQLTLNIEGKIRTWAIKWYASSFLQNGLALHPKKSLVQNIGSDNTGDNSPKTNYFWHDQLAENVEVKAISIQEDKQILELIKAYYRSFKLPFVQRIRGRLKLLFGNK